MRHKIIIIFPPAFTTNRVSLSLYHSVLVQYDVDFDIFYLSASSKRVGIESSENIKWKLIFRFAELSHYSPNQTIYSSLSWLPYKMHSQSPYFAYHLESFSLSIIALFRPSTCKRVVVFRPFGNYFFTHSAMRWLQVFVAIISWSFQDKMANKNC